MAEKYTDYIQKAHWQYHRRRTIEAFGSFFLPFIKEGNIGLDAGCGTGSITSSISKYLGENGKIIGVDVNKNVLEVASNQFGDYKNVSFTEGNLYKLPFEDNTFDFVFSHGVLIHCEKPELVLKECYRVLKKGGVIGISSVDHDSILIHPDKNGLLRKSIDLQEDLWKMGSGWGSTSNEGSNLRLGKRLKELLVNSGFLQVCGYARTDVNGDTESILHSSKQEIDALSAQPFIDRALELRLSTKEEIDNMIQAWQEFANNPVAYRAKLVCEATGIK